MILSSMVESTTSAERMTLSLFLSVGRGGSGGRASGKAGEGAESPFPPDLGGMFGGCWGLAFSFLPAAFLIKPSTTSIVLALTLTALPLTVCACVKAERVLGLLITIPLGGPGGPGEEEGVCDFELAT